MARNVKVNDVIESDVLGSWIVTKVEEEFIIATKQIAVHKSALKSWKKVKRN